jgi:outer membrane protein assembly factor BamB
MKIDAKLRGHLPRVSDPVAWSGKDRKGWKVSIPGGRPLATPALADGRLFLGAGFGSYDFFAFDALSGSLLWQYQTEDDGPTAAVVQEDLVAFNTESCELEVLTVEGKSVWKKWLGDPLMSMPAIQGERIFQAYPDSRTDHHYYLAAFELRTGRELWKQPLPGEVITAPVLAEGNVHLAHLDGAISCFQQEDGKEIWREEKKATSSPAVWQGQCYFSQREEVIIPRAAGGGVQQTEHLSARGRGAKAATVAYAATAAKADYLDHAKRQARSPHYALYQHADSMVGFGAHKGSAKMAQAMGNLGQGHVSGLWAYQGSKPFVYRGRLFSAIGDAFHCVEPNTKEVFWKRCLHDNPDGQEVLDNCLTPPALANGKLFAGTIQGEVCCLAAETGEVLWRESLGEPVIFQPAVVNGRVYAATNSGNLFCLETGDPRDDGWFMWGATAAHNGSSS